jgi:hypothetical protein
VGAIISQGNETSETSTSVTPLGDVVEANNVLIISIAVDNTGTTDADNNEVSSVTDTKSNTYSKLGEFTQSSGAAADGVTTSLWQSRITTQLETSDTITVNFANTVVAKAFQCWEFTAGAPLTVAGSNQNATTGNGWGSLSISGLAAGTEYLYFRACSKESADNVQMTATTNYSLISHRRSGNSGTSSVGIWGEFRIVTATSETSNPTRSVSTDNSSVMVALVESGSPPPPSPRRRIIITETAALREWPKIY